RIVHQEILPGCPRLDDEPAVFGAGRRQTAGLEIEALAERRGQFVEIPPAAAAEIEQAVGRAVYTHALQLTIEKADNLGIDADPGGRSQIATESAAPWQMRPRANDETLPRRTAVAEGAVRGECPLEHEIEPTSDVQGRHVQRIVLQSQRRRHPR